MHLYLEIYNYIAICEQSVATHLQVIRAMHRTLAKYILICFSFLFRTSDLGLQTNR